MLGSPLISLLFWILICFSIAALFTKRYSIRPLIVALILRSIYYLGIGPTLNILGALNVSARGPQPPPLRVHHAVGREAGLPPTGHCSAASLGPCAGIITDPRDHSVSPPSSWTTQGSRQSEPARQEPPWSPSFRAAGYLVWCAARRHTEGIKDLCVKIEVKCIKQVGATFL